MSEVDLSQTRPAGTAPEKSPTLENVPEHPTLSPEEEHEKNTLGMWVFLAGEVMFFGALFTAYTIYRIIYPQVFAEASGHLDAVLGGFNTALLLTSSLTMALAVRSAKLGRSRPLAFFLAATIGLAAVFIGIKLFDYSHLIREGYFPGRLGKSVDQSAQPQPIRLFFSLYFAMTGLHAVHMLLGMLVMALMAGLAWLKRIPAERSISVEMLGLYWHFVDIVWIFLYPLFYLIHRTG